jgi:hypothetical protein
LADVENGPQSLQERPQFGRLESDIQRRRDSLYSKACMISNDELRKVRHVQSDAITFLNAMFDQAAREAIDLSGQSFISPDFFVFSESNLFRTCFRMII